MLHIQNNQAAFTGTAPNTWKDADGLALPYPQEVITMRANAAIAMGQWCMWVAPTATTPLSVTPGTTTAADATLFAGIALETVTTAQVTLGAMVTLVVAGFAMGLMETGGTGAATAITAGSGQVLTAGGTTAGSLAATTTIDAALIASRVFGIPMGAKLAAFGGTALHAPVWISKS